MSTIAPAIITFTRALAELDAALRSTEGWRDDQRVRLERAQLVPLRAEANRFAAALSQLDASLDASQRLLGT
jgi:hypothetical protein